MSNKTIKISKPGESHTVSLSLPTRLVEQVKAGYEMEGFTVTYDDNQESHD